METWWPLTSRRWRAWRYTLHCVCCIGKLSNVVMADEDARHAACDDDDPHCLDFNRSGYCREHLG